MMEWILNITALTQTEFVILIGLTLFAGIVRGFSGFALSAMVMATAVVILPPITLLPILWWLEMSASLLMLKGGWSGADKTMTYGLVGGSFIGWPIGLALTMYLPVEASKALALSVIVVLALTQLLKVRMAFLATKPGLYGSGIMSGFVSGISGVGGMVVALYVLAVDRSAAVMRSTLVLYLFLSSALSLVLLLATGVMDMRALTRGLVFAVPTMIGVFLGQQLFTERFAPYYRSFCLILLIGLASVGLIRTQLS